MRETGSMGRGQERPQLSLISGVWCIRVSWLRVSHMEKWWLDMRTGSFMRGSGLKGLSGGKEWRSYILMKRVTL